MMGNYVIVLALDGKYHCAGRLQDGTERWTEETQEAAITSMKQFAKVMNHTRIKKKDITFLREESVIERKFVNVPWNQTKAKKHVDQPANN